MPTITHQQAKRFYDRLGQRQDWQAVFEDPAVDELIRLGRFERARSVCEFGCGTGRLAERLLANHLPADATYIGLDISETMTGLAAKRLESFSDRAVVIRTHGAPRIPVADATVDRLLAAYVLDLLSPEDIQAFLGEARRVLTETGLLCTVNLTFGRGPGSGFVSRTWSAIHRWRPALLGGCRPLRLTEFLTEGPWRLDDHNVVCRLGICSEVSIVSLSGQRRA